MMNQPVLQAPLETQGEFPRNPVDDINIDTEDVESEEKNHNEGEVIIRTHKGSGERVITLEHLKQVGHLPQQQAADHLNVGNTRFKMATRQLGMKAWPYRKIKSIRNLISVVEQNMEYFPGEAENLLLQLHQLEEMIFKNPTMPLNEDFRKFRQAAYKLTHKSKRTDSAPGWENQADGQQDDDGDNGTALMKVAGKKLVIKPLRLQPKLPDDFESSNWDRLKDAVGAVQSARPVSCSLEELYTAVENLCVHNLAAKVYPQLQGLCDHHAETMINSLASRSSLDALAFLDHVGRTWERYCSQLLLIRQIFLYLDRTYVLTSSPTRSLFDMGLQLFRAHLGRHPEVERKLVDGLLALIDAERNGEAVDRGLLKELLRMLSNLAMYGDSFQWPFLDRSARYFTAEGERLIQEMETSAYLEHCERRLAEEYARCDAYLEPSTKAPLIAAVESGLVEGHVGQLVGSGFDSLLNSDRYPDLKRLYGLCARVGALRALCAAFKVHIQKVGAHIVLDEEKESEMVPSLLKLKGRMDRALHESFSSNPSFANALKEGFEAFINQRANKPAELLAKFMDVALRGGTKGATAAGAGGSSTAAAGAGPTGGEEEVEASVDAALVLFRYIQGKDVFEAFYKKDLAKRLLLGRFASIDAEKAAISKLKAECGSQFTSKLEGMFKDVELSKDAMASFRQSPTASASLSQLCPGIDVTVQVLTSGFWPTYPVLDCALPEKLAAAQHVFSEHYLQKHSGRKLAWINSLGTCIIKAHFNSGDKELSVSLFQAAVLMLFNDEDKLSLPDIAAATGLEDRELRRTLQSLACGRERVLLKEPKGREVLDGDVFSFNAAYTSRLYRVRINAIQLKETAEEQAKTNESVLQDRQYQVDAAIVRIMKTRKTLAHKLLVNELVAQLRFPVVGADLKKRIESLIDREYLERDPDDAQVYNYLA